MSKTKWHTKVIYLGVALSLALGLLLMPAAAGADPGLSKWSRVTTPEVDGSDNVIRTDSDIKDFAVGPDGDTIYAIGIEDGDPELWKSTNGGASWSNKTSDLNDADDLPGDAFSEVTAVAVSPDDASFVAVAGIVDGQPVVVISDDGASGFASTGLEDVAGATEVSPRCLDISKEYGNDRKAIAVGTTNPALVADGGKVFLGEVGGLTLGWKDTSEKDGWMDSISVTSMAFSPAYATDKTLVVITSSSTASHLQCLKWAYEKAWNAEAVFSAFPVKIDDVVGFSDMALPSDYMGGVSGDRNVFAILTGQVTDIEDDDYGDVVSRVYQIENYTPTQPCGPDSGAPLLASIAYNGEADEGKAMVSQLADSWSGAAPVERACCAGMKVWRTDEITDCCPEWKVASKSPSGQLWCIVDYTPDGNKAYASSMGTGLADESAFSVSLDDGKVWNQISLIDTDIDYLSDAAVSPDCDVTYLASVNILETGEICECDSVWRLQEEADEYAGVWQRVLYKALEGSPDPRGTEEGLLRLAVDATDGEYVVLADRATNNIWPSTNSGETWSTKTASLDIGDFAVESAEVIYVLEDGGDMVAKSTDNAWTWEPKVDTKITIGHTISVTEDGDVLVAPANGGSKKVAYSDDGAESFSRTEKLTPDGNAHAAFDSYYSDNDTIYAVVDNGGIYRWVIGESSEWKDLGAEEHGYYGIVMDNAAGNPMTQAKKGGVLYAAFYDADEDESGVARCLTPADTPCCRSESWDYLIQKAAGKDFSLEPSDLKICGCLSSTTNSNLYAIDDTAYDYADKDGCLWVYEDCFAKEAPSLVSPADGATIASDPCYCWNDDFTLKWERLCNACDYKVYIALDPTCDTEIVDTIIVRPPSGANPSYVVSNGDLSCSTTYYWRVKAIEAETEEEIQSFRSEVRSFTVAAGPEAGIDLTAPDDGSTSVPKSNVGFTWTAVQDADGYDFVLSKSADLSSPVDSATGLKNSSYSCTKDLGYSSTYYWQVTAKKGANILSKSSVGTFTTVAEEKEPPPPVVVKEYPPAPPPSTPGWVWAVIGIGAVLVIVVIVLIFRTRRV